MKRINRLLFLSVILLTIYPLKVYCQPSDEEIETSIVAGIDYLINGTHPQFPEGFWAMDEGVNEVAYTGIVLMKLCDYAYEQGYDSPFDEEYDYHQNVTKGFNYLFTKVRDTYEWAYSCEGIEPGSVEMEGMYIGDEPVGAQPEMYNATFATMALGACNTPDSVIDCPGSPADGMTHFALMQEMVDFYRWAQNKESSPSTNFGGWGNRPWLAPYCWDNGEWGNTYSDNASSGYVVFALQYAEKMGCDIPYEIREYLSVWINFIQIDEDVFEEGEGGSGYSLGTYDPWGNPPRHNCLRTGNLLAEMAFAGYPLEHPRVQSALSYISTYWDTPTAPDLEDLTTNEGWAFWPMAMYSLMKGFKSYGLSTIMVDGVESNWYNEFSTQLLGVVPAPPAPTFEQPWQFWSGNWAWGWWGDDITNTCWALLILEGKNQPPEITDILVPVEPVAITEPVNITVNYTDPDDPQGVDEYECWFVDFGDGNTSSSSEVGLSCTSEHVYAEPGVYTVKVRVTDKGGLYDEETALNYIVIFDPSDGFVTGGGWIDSPPDAYVSDPTLTGSANFGFVAKYKKGKTTPDGTTEFQFQAGNLNFHSTSYEWLLIAHHKAMFKGEGTINGEGEYGFQLNAIDEKLTPSTDVDMFRIKIWDKLTGNTIYDNNFGSAQDADPATEITGGSITIHKSNLKNAKINDNIPDDFALRNYPNPFTNSTLIEFSLPEETNVLLRVFNISGQQIKLLSNKNYPAGTHFEEFNGEEFPAGQYLYQIKTADFIQTNKMILNK